jgi:dsRNA-specific ribonuclease
MKRLRLLRWSGTVLSPRTRPEINQPHLVSFFRLQSTTSSSDLSMTRRTPKQTFRNEEPLTEEQLLKLPSPPVQAVHTSAKLSALHARLSLPPRLPLETLARTLVDPSADSSPQFNNKPFSLLGNDLLGYYTSEFIVCQYPRLPLAVVYAAMYAYVGGKALTAITREWGVETAAAPGGEVDPGLLQLKMLPPDTAQIQPIAPLVSTAPEPNASGFRRSISSRTVYDDEFGELRNRPGQKDEETSSKPDGTTVTKASSNFVRAVMGAVYLHGGRVAAKQFYREHFMSRQLAMADLFNFRFPTRDLSRLCAREGFRSPVARILSETGRKSRHPVFVVGVYSGNDKLGEGAGSSLDEARTRAAVAALKGWYLYSPVDFRVPSETEEEGVEPWSPVLVDSGDIVV